MAMKFLVLFWKEENFLIRSVSPDDTAFFSMNLSVELSCCCIFLVTFMVVKRRDSDNQFSGTVFTIPPKVH